MTSAVGTRNLSCACLVEMEGQGDCCDAVAGGRGVNHTGLDCRC